MRVDTEAKEKKDKNEESKGLKRRKRVILIIQTLMRSMMIMFQENIEYYILYCY
jgi:hypothetical protein